MAAPPLRLHGQNVRVTLFLDGTPFAQSALAKSIDIDEFATMHRDGFLGSDADDPDKQTRGYDAKLELFKANSTLFKALLDRETKRVARVPYPVLSIGVVFENRDGTNEAFLLDRCELKTKLSTGGATEHVMESLEATAKYCKPISL